MSIRIEEMPEYQSLLSKFEEKGYTRGEKVRCPDPIVRGYISDMDYSRREFQDVPDSCRTREFFINAMTGSRCKNGIVYFAMDNPKMFDKKFFKDHIETNYYCLEFELNDFEWMPVELIDEELAMCAMLRSIDMRYSERRGDCEDWFYSVAKRKPEVLTQELYTLGARCFAYKGGPENRNKFLEVTPQKYRTRDYFFAMCAENDSPVMEDFPKRILTTDFLEEVLEDNPENIRCFSEAELNRKDKTGREFWKTAVLKEGRTIRYLQLNDERVDFFLAHYDKDTSEYEYCFKDNYKRWKRKKDGIPEPEDTRTSLAGLLSLALAMGGAPNDEAIDAGSNMARLSVDKKAMLPIHCDRYIIPEKYRKKYDSDEYLQAVYKRLDIEILSEADYYYYNVKLPEDVSVNGDYREFVITKSGKEVIKYIDCGPFYDREVEVRTIDVELEE